MDEIRVLGRFVPSRLQAEVIQAELRPLLPACCRCENIGVRIPHDRAPAPHPDNLEWHQDGGGSEGTTKHMIVWATEDTTELRTSDGKYFRGQPYELVWYDNTRAFHRQPRGTDETRRWWLAVRCSGAIF